MDKTIHELLFGRDNNFDFIRFCAALAVIFSHSYPLTGNLHEPLEDFSEGFMTFGSLSVAVFFIISGLLIAQSFDRTSRVVHFFEARILRIFPALIVTVLLTVLVLGPILTTFSLKQYFTDVTTLKYLFNITALRIQYILPGVFEHNPLHAVNGSLWTLPLELACYWLVASALSLSKKRYVQSLILLVIVGVLFHNRWINVNTFYFTIGTGLYVGRKYIKMNTCVAVLAAFGLICSLSVNMAHIYSYTLFGFTLAYITLYLGFIETKYLKHFSKYGDFSYGLYIWAFPIQQTVIYLFPNLSLPFHFAVSALAALIMAIGSWHLVEKQGLKLKRKLRYDFSMFKLSKTLIQEPR